MVTLDDLNIELEIMSWEKVKFDDVCEIYGGTTPSTVNASYWDGNNIWLSPADLPEIGIISHIKNSTRKITDSALKESSLTLLPTGSIVYSTRASIGKIGITDVPLATNQGFANFVCKENLFNKFLCYALKHFTPQIAKLSNSTTFSEVSRTSIRNFKIPLPSLSTQNKIAAILDQAGELRKKDQQLLARYDVLLQSIFYDMFGDPVMNEKGWEKVTLKKTCIQITDGTHFSPPSLLEGVPYITAKHVKKDGVDFYSKPTFVSQKEHEEIYKRCKPVKGDVLYIKDGATTGIAAINNYDFEFSMLSSLALIKPDIKRLNNYFLVQWLNNSAVKKMYIRSFMAGAAIQRFTLQKINAFEILLPPIDLQNRFAAIAQNIQQQKQQIKQQLQQSEALFQTLLEKAFNEELIK